LLDELPLLYDPLDELLELPELLDDEDGARYVPLLFRDAPEPDERLTLDPRSVELLLLPTLVRVEEAFGLYCRLLLVELPRVTLPLLPSFRLEEPREPTALPRLVVAPDERAAP
jgi:hypothetical protein